MVSLQSRVKIEMNPNKNDCCGSNKIQETTDRPMWLCADPSSGCKDITRKPAGTGRWRWLLQIHFSSVMRNQQVFKQKQEKRKSGIKYLLFIFYQQLIILYTILLVHFVNPIITKSQYSI